MWFYLFVKILENEIWKFGRNLPLATFGRERVKLWSASQAKPVNVCLVRLYYDQAYVDLVHFSQIRQAKKKSDDGA